jgi:HEPN domain-containing protein
MTNDEMAQSYLLTAQYSLKQAEAACSDQVWHLAVRRCQEAAEMALKAALRLVGVEVPRVHDVGFALQDKRDRFPTWFQERIDRMVRISRGLRGDRELSVYGDEALGRPPQAIFTMIDANEGLEEAAFVLEQVGQIFAEYQDRRRKENS